MTKKNAIFNILIIFSIFFLDRFTKFYILNIAETQGVVDIKVNSFINIILVWNSGIGFGLFQLDQAFAYNLITILILFINLIIVYLLFYADDLRKILFSMILGGSLGNFYDRIFFEAVPDFIDFHVENFHWFIFNVSDIFISLGVIFMIILEVISNNKEHINENN